MRAIGRKVAGIALLTGGVLLGFSSGREIWEMASAGSLEAVFWFGKNPPRLVKEDPYEQIFNKLRFDRPDKKLTKMLLLAGSADVDGNNAIAPKETRLFPVNLSWKTELTYKVIHHPLQICEEIQSVAKTGPIEDIAFNFHGEPSAMLIGPTSYFKVFDSLPQGCFDGLAAAARIFLVSCSTGAPSWWKPNFAEWMSWISGREVIAPTALVSRDTINSDIDPTNGRLEMRLMGPDIPEGSELPAWLANTVDYTTHFNPSASWSETALFSMKMAIPTILGAMVTWKTARFAAMILQGSGTLTDWLVDKSAAPIKRLAERNGLYHPKVAQVLYGVAKGTGKILNLAGKLAHQGMDQMIQTAGKLGYWGLGKSVATVKALIQTFF